MDTYPLGVEELISTFLGGLKMLLKTCVDNLPCKWNSIFSFQMYGQSIFFLQNEYISR